MKKKKKLFKNWIIGKDKEKQKQRTIENDKKKGYKRKHSEVIGPYSCAKILRQMQKFYDNNDINQNKNNKNNALKRNNTAQK